MTSQTIIDPSSQTARLAGVRWLPPAPPETDDGAIVAVQLTPPAPDGTQPSFSDLGIGIGVRGCLPVLVSPEEAAALALVMVTGETASSLAANDRPRFWCGSFGEWRQRHAAAEAELMGSQRDEIEAAASDAARGAVDAVLRRRASERALKL